MGHGTQNTGQRRTRDTGHRTRERAHGTLDTKKGTQNAEHGPRRATFGRRRSSRNSSRRTREFRRAWALSRVQLRMHSLSTRTRNTTSRLGGSIKDSPQPPIGFSDIDGHKPYMRRSQHIPTSNLGSSRTPGPGTGGMVEPLLASGNRSFNHIPDQFLPCADRRYD